MKIILTSIILSSCIVASIQASEKPSLPVPPEAKAAAVSVIKGPSKPIVKGPMVPLIDDSLPNNHKKSFNEETGKYEIVDTTNPPLWTRFG